MKLGVVFPQTELQADRGSIVAFTRAVEELGFVRLLSFDHVLGADPRDRTPPLQGPYTVDHEFHEPLTLFAFMSAITESVQFVTSVMVLPQRQTALVAKQAAQLSLLSDGRFVLGVGSGWNRVEFEALGRDFAGRGKVLDAQIPLLRRLWSQAVMEERSEHHVVDRAGIAPLPRHPIPIWVGGFGGAAFRRAANLGDGFVFGLLPPVDGMTSAEAQVVQAHRIRELRRRAHGYDADFHFEGRLDNRLPADEWRRELDRFAAAGFSGVSVNLAGAGLRWAGEFIDAMVQCQSRMSRSV